MRRVLMRWNVLILMSMAYLTVLALFGVLAFGDLTIEEAYEIVNAPLMALIGGTLAISKDLIEPYDKSPSDGEGSS